MTFQKVKDNDDKDIWLDENGHMCVCNCGANAHMQLKTEAYLTDITFTEGNATFGPFESIIYVCRGCMAKVLERIEQ